MAKMTKKIDVVAPPDRIYGTLHDPNAMPLFVPAVTNVSNVQKTEKRVGDTFRATYGLMGMHFDLTFTVRNIFDKQPPIVGNNAGTTAFNSGNTYPSTYDPLGRSFAAGARIKF